jgi:hypothetical protein
VLVMMEFARFDGKKEVFELSDKCKEVMQQMIWLA